MTTEYTEYTAQQVTMTPYPNWYEDVGRFASACRDGGCPDPARFKSIGMHCVESRHHAATRPFMFRFDIRDISRIAAQQLLRHTIGLLPMMESGRHVDITNNNPILPPSIAANKEAHGIWEDLVWDTKIAYDKLLKLGIPKEDARMVTLQCESTKLTIYLTFEALLNLYSERMCPHAQWEIRAVVGGIYKEFIKEFPELTERFVLRCDSVGHCLEKAGCGRWAK